MATYHNSKSLDSKAEHVKLELAVASQRNTARYHKNNGDESAIRILNAERKRNQKNRYRGEGLRKNY